MHTADRDLQSLRQELESLFEHRIGDLLGQVKAVQSVTRQILAAEEDIYRQEYMQQQLMEELTPLESSASALETENKELASKVATLRANVERMKDLKRMHPSERCPRLSARRSMTTSRSCP